MNTKTKYTIAAQYYAIQELAHNPAKTVSFIRNNKESFPQLNDEWLKQIMNEHNITEEDILKYEVVDEVVDKVVDEVVDEVECAGEAEFAKLTVNLKEKEFKPVAIKTKDGEWINLPK